MEILRSVATKGRKIVCDETGLSYRSFDELAAELGLSDQTVRRRIQEGKDIGGVVYRINGPMRRSRVLKPCAMAAG
jgi:biotin operon repressor